MFDPDDYDSSYEIENIECDEENEQSLDEKISRHDMCDFYGLSRSDFM